MTDLLERFADRRRTAHDAGAAANQRNALRRFSSIHFDDDAGW